MTLISPRKHRHPPPPATPDSVGLSTDLPVTSSYKFCKCLEMGIWKQLLELQIQPQTGAVKVEALPPCHFPVLTIIWKTHALLTIASVSESATHSCCHSHHCYYSTRAYHCAERWARCHPDRYLTSAFKTLTKTKWPNSHFLSIKMFFLGGWAGRHLCKPLSEAYTKILSHKSTFQHPSCYQHLHHTRYKANIFNLSWEQSTHSHLKEGHLFMYSGSHS